VERRHFLTLSLGAGVALLLPAAPVPSAPGVREHHRISERSWNLGPVEREADAWRELVEDDAWRILFREGTEPRHSSPLNEVWADGTYVCAACHLPLFSSATKYDSHTGWPSFYAPFRTHLGTKVDRKLFVARTEYHCVRCGGHQGHVFDDGPEPTGERWCNNGLALRFVAAGEPLPALRG